MTEVVLEELACKVPLPKEGTTRQLCLVFGHIYKYVGKPGI